MKGCVCVRERIQLCKEENEKLLRLEVGTVFVSSLHMMRILIPHHLQSELAGSQSSSLICKCVGEKREQQDKMCRLQTMIWLRHTSALLTRLCTEEAQKDMITGATFGILLQPHAPTHSTCTFWPSSIARPVIFNPCAVAPCAVGGSQVCHGIWGRPFFYQGIWGI